MHTGVFGSCAPTTATKNPEWHIPRARADDEGATWPAIALLLSFQEINPTR
jgi:hypothetical protein